MADDLKSIREAWGKRDARGVRSSSGKASLEDDQTVYSKADAYVKAHAKDFAGWENLPLEALVKTLETHRENGQPDEEAKVQIWLWHKFEPQNIGGTYEPKLRVSNGR